jgi:hypothetical protein
MQLTRKKIGTCLLLSAEEPVLMRDNIASLRNVVEETLKDGVLHIALEFPLDSFFNTDAIGMLVRCAYMITDQGGRMTFVGPNDQLCSIMRDFDLYSVIGVVQTVDELSDSDASLASR